jgi:hypothetical protein
MSREVEFRARAAQWRTRAASCSDGEMRRHFEEIAHEWERMADFAKGLDRDFVRGRPR